MPLHNCLLIIALCVSLRNSFSLVALILESDFSKQAKWNRQNNVTFHAVFEHKGKRQNINVATVYVMRQCTELFLHVRIQICSYLLSFVYLLLLNVCCHKCSPGLICGFIFRLEDDVIPAVYKAVPLLCAGLVWMCVILVRACEILLTQMSGDFETTRTVAHFRFGAFRTKSMPVQAGDWTAFQN